MLRRTTRWLPCILVVAACTKGPEGNDTGGETSGSSDGLTDGAEVTGAPSSSGDPSVPTAPTGISSITEPADTGVDPSATDAGSFTDTATDAGSFTDTESNETEDFDTDGDDCNADTYTPGPPGEPGFQELLDTWNPDALGQANCPWNPGACSDDPIPGLASALVVRNDALPVPRDFVPGSARWLVWSNVALECSDPFGAPLCDGQWRVSWAVSSGTWCREIREIEGGHGFGLSHGTPYILEVGDAGCAATEFTIADDDDSYADVHFPADPILPYFAPQPGTLCSQCQLPGGLELVIGGFEASICPE